MLKGQLDKTMVRMSGEAMHNMSGMVGRAKEMRGQMNKGMKQVTAQMPSVSKPKVSMKGQLS